MTALVEMRNITKEFRGIAALKNVNFDLRKGEIHSIVGENGAGKSTLTKIMAGVTTATAGSMTIEGRPVSFQIASGRAAERGHDGVPRDKSRALDDRSSEHLPW